LSCKVVHNWGEKHGKHSTGDKEVETEVCKWLRQEPKDCYVAGFNTLVKL
jgi:hypothetical protein